MYNNIIIKLTVSISLLSMAFLFLLVNFNDFKFSYYILLLLYPIVLFFLLSASLSKVDVIFDSISKIFSIVSNSKEINPNEIGNLEFLEQKVNSYVEKINNLEMVRSQFIADISHELKTPIFLLKGYVETIEGEIDSKTREEFIKKIKIQMDKVENILEDLIHISMIESNDITLKLEKVEMQSIVDDLDNRFTPIVEKRGDKFILPDAKNIFVDIDKTKFLLALENIIKNAIFYSDSGDIIFTVKKQFDNSIRIGITDHGIGIPRDEQSKILQRFYRTDESRSRNTGGTGLGLAIVKHICNAHNIKLSINSQDGVGSTFYLDIPQS